MSRERTPTRSRMTFTEAQKGSPESGHLEQVNDDEAEKEQRRQELLQELESRHMESPGTPASRRKSCGIAPAGLTNAQIAEHYANCIRLSMENKITTKNAFNLHLIDYMHKMLRNEDGTANFQVASCTLDAGTKIYAHRVDRIHIETMQIAGELGIQLRKRKRFQKECEVDDNEGDMEEDEQAPKKQKTRRVKTSRTIVRNLKSITIERIETKRRREVLVEKISANHQESTTGGLFLNHIWSLDDSGKLMYGSGFIPTASMFKGDSNAFTVITSHVQRVLFNMASKKLSILRDLFESSDEEEECPIRGLDSFMRQPTQNVSFDNKDTAMDLSDEDVPICDGVPSGTERITGCSTVEIAKYLAPVPSDYSYFTKQFFSAWAGPSHWKIKPLSKLKQAEPNVARRKQAKGPSKFDFETAVANPALFVKSKRLHQLSKRTLETWKSDKLLLPRDRCQATDTLFRSLQLCKGHRIMQVPRPGTTGEITYDYGNRNDNENFCPNELDDNIPADDTHTGLGSPAPTVNTTALTAAAATLDDTLFRNSAKLQYEYTGDNLIKQPYKIPRVHLNYARVAKRFDMKQMKQAMWDVLTDSNENKENVEHQQPPPQKVEKPLSFRKMCTILPRHLNRTNRESVTIPVAFTALLHLAAERNFPLIGREDMSDVTISV